MRVVLDISILGHGYRTQSARTGIFRVVERTARGLESRTDISTSFASAESWENYYWAERYLASLGEIPRDRLVPRGLGSRSLQHLQSYLYGPAAKARGEKERQLSTRVLRRLCGAITSRTSSLPRSAVSGFDIFHSGFHAFPATTLGVSGLSRFVTIYDLIPLLMPQYFAEGFAVGVRQTFIHMLQSIRKDDFVLAISECTKKDLCSNVDINEEQVFVSPLAAAKEVFYPVVDREAIDITRKRYGIPDGAKYLLSLNTLEPRKNMDQALRCFVSAIQQSSITDLYFVLAGSKGWDYQSILQAIKHAGSASSRVILAGYVPDSELAALYSGAVAFVYPSHYEGFGLPPLEAMQCGTPVITSNTSSLPEVVGNAGIMVSPTDSDALSHAMLELYGQPMLRSVLASQSLVRAAQFSWDRYTDSVVDSYRSALGN